MAKIMLVEDDNNLREIYGARLLAEGHEIVTAKDGEEALATAVKEKPDLIISDVMMPRISGFDMLDILRNAPETKFTKVIMMTALSQAEDKARADSLGADRYLVKSQVTLEDVARVVKDVLEGKTETESAPAPVATEVASPEQPATPATPEAPTTVPETTPTSVTQESPATSPEQPAATSPVASAAEPNPEVVPVNEPSAVPEPAQAVSPDPVPAPDPAAPATPADPGASSDDPSDDTQTTVAAAAVSPTIVAATTPTPTPDPVAVPTPDPNPVSVTADPQPTVLPQINVELPGAAQTAEASTADKPAEEAPPEPPVLNTSDFTESQESNIGPNLAEALQAEEEQATAEQEPAPEPEIPVVPVPVTVQEPVKEEPSPEPAVAAAPPAAPEPPVAPEPTAPVVTAPEPVQAVETPTETISLPEPNVIKPTEPPKAEPEPAVELADTSTPSPLADDSHKKMVIQPINDITKGPDLNALLENENKNAAVINPAVSTVITPDAPAAPAAAPSNSNQHDIISL